MDEHLIDKRVIQKYLSKGKVDPKEYRRHLDALPDLADRVVRGGTHEEAASESKAQAEPAAQHASLG